MEKKISAHLIISGRVQGVCYRMETRTAASRIGVTGWVRNRPDGTVEAVIEGDAQPVQRMIEWCKQGPPISNVAKVDVRWKDYSGDYSGFDITY